MVYIQASKKLESIFTSLLHCAKINVPHGGFSAPCHVYNFFLLKPTHNRGCGNASVKRNQQNKKFLLYCCNYRLCLKAFLHLQISFSTGLESHFKFEIEVNIKYEVRHLQVPCYFSVSILRSNASEEADINPQLQKNSKWTAFNQSLLCIPHVMLAINA